MKTWEARPKDEAYLLNPAFCCAILTAAFCGYADVKEEGVPFPLAFMFLPIVLHKATRDKLPPNTRTSMPAWLQENSDARVLFYERLMSLKPHTKEAVQFGMSVDWIVLRDGGFVGATLSKLDVSRTIRRLAGEARECIMRAQFIGKWFASAGAAHAVMAFWGIRP